MNKSSHGSPNRGGRRAPGRRRLISGTTRWIRKARQAGLETARQRRLTWHREHRNDQHDHPAPEPDDVGE